MKRFFIGSALALAAMLSTCAGPAISAEAAHDEISSQTAREVPRELAAPQELFAQVNDTAAESAGPATIVGVSPDPAPSAVADFTTWLIGMMAMALSALAGWVLKRTGLSGDALASITHLVDNAIDLVRVVAARELSGMADRVLLDTTAGRTFEVVWPLAKKYAAQLGWTEAQLRKYIESRIAPETA
jgi:hypothetical protein